MTTQSETKQYLYDLICLGTQSLNSLNQAERQKLIARFVSDLGRYDSPFEDQQISTLWLSNFLINPTCTIACHRVATDFVDCILAAHKHELEQLFDEMMTHYERECGVPSDYDDWKAIDDSERYKAVSGF